MGIIHTPRVLATVAKGMMKRSKSENRARIGVVDPHKYYARAGLFDVDYLGHLNNAAFFNHAEYARWEMSAENGWLEAMMKNNAHYLLASASCRYRAEIRPIFRKFQIDSIVAGVDDKSLWVYHTFRHTEKGDDRVRAQIIVKGKFLKDRKVIDPRQFLEEVGVGPDVLGELYQQNAEPSMQEMVSSFEALENAKRKESALDDDKVKG